jgi:hypothetical protein
MRERKVLVPDLAEKVDAICSCEQRRGDCVHRRVAPALFHSFDTIQSGQFLLLLFSSDFEQAGRGDKGRRYLVVKATEDIEIFKERRVGFAAPKIHIGNLKVAPNFFFFSF